MSRFTRLLYLCAIAVGATAQPPPQYLINTTAGTGVAGFSGDAGPAFTAEVNNPWSVLVTSSGVLVVDTFNNRVRFVNTSTGWINTVAGNGTRGSTGSGGTATSAALKLPAAVAVDDAGDLYVSEHGGDVVRVISSATGVISGFAGTGVGGYAGDTGAATSAQLNGPWGVAWASNVVYIADSANAVVRAVAGGVITTVAGNGTWGFNGESGVATQLLLNYPCGLAESGGVLYVADAGNNRIRALVISTSQMSTVAGSGDSASSAGSYTGDGGLAVAATLFNPSGVAVSPAGEMWIADTANDVVRYVDAGGVIHTVAGDAVEGAPPSPGGYNGDGEVATAASLFGPTGVALDAEGRVFVADADNDRVRVLTPCVGGCSGTPTPTSTGSPRATVSSTRTPGGGGGGGEGTFGRSGLVGPLIGIVLGVIVLVLATLFVWSKLGRKGEGRPYQA